MARKIFFFIWELLKLVVISLVIILPVRYFLIQPFYVKGASMEPNFHDYEYLIINELTYHFEPLERGQVIVFRYPRDPQEFFIKRVIGLPGEQVQIKDGKVIIYNTAYPNGLTLNEPYLGPGVLTESNNDNKITLNSDEYYVLGDNRSASQDSRFFGPVNKSFIIGSVWFRGLPLNKITLFSDKNLPKY
jgi:signal peptidase I